MSKNCINFKIELRWIYEEIGSIRDENHNQNIEIALLKDIITKELYSQAHNDNHSSNKRPARLLPQRILYGKGKKKLNVTNSPIFCGPPKNCSDLTKLGYTLNGFYLVESPIITNESLTKIETVYCSFRQPKEFNASLLESRVGFLTLSRLNMTENIYYILDFWSYSPVKVRSCGNIYYIFGHVHHV